MGEKTGISWTDSTWPIVQGCDYDSPGCTHCYVVPLLWRLSHNPLSKISEPLQGLVTKDAREKLHFTGRVELRHDRLRDPLGWKKPRMIFVPSHGDIFHKNVPDSFLHRIFATMACTPRHTYQVLTKRSDRACDYLNALGKSIAPLEDAAREIGYTFKFEGIPLLSWPLPNVWIGASTEDQARLEKRWPFLRDAPAAKRFISYEPALGPLYLNNVFVGRADGVDVYEDVLSGAFSHVTGLTPEQYRNEDHPEGDWMVERAPRQDWGPKLDWTIIGGESGGKPRPFDIKWARDTVNKCCRAEVPVFVKQMGSNPFAKGQPVEFEDRKGGDMEEWPEDLRVREFPQGFAPMY